MNSEFKKSKSNTETRYVLENSATVTTGAVATAPSSLGKVQKRGNILAQEADKKKEAPKPRNFVAKNAKMGGAGQHKDKKKEQKQGVAKHKKPFMEEMQARLDQLKSKLEESERTMSRAAKGNEKYGKDGMKALAKAGREGASEKKLDAIRDKHDNYNEDSDPCWDSHKMVGTKKKGGKTVPNCVPKESLAEGFNHEYDDEAGMAQSNLLTTARAVMGLLKTIKDRDNLPEWGQEKIAKAEMMLVSVWDYLQSQKEMGNDPQQSVAEGLGKTIKRGMAGWGAFDKDKPADVVKRVKGQDTDTLKGLSNRGSTGKGSPAELQQKAISRELKKRSEQGVAEGASDYVGDAIEALRVSKPGLGQEDFLDELYMYIENQYGQRAAEMMSNAGQDDFDEWYDSYTDMAEAAPKGWEGTVKAMKKHDEIDNPYALAHYMKNKGYKSHKKEDAYMESLAQKLDQVKKK